MSITLLVRDEVVGGERGPTTELTLPAEQLTVRELIRERVYQEVQDFNAKGGNLFKGLVQPTDAERVLNGFKLKAPRKIQWKPQFERAVAAFEARQILVLVDNRQVESLDEIVAVSPGSEVTFLKLVLLAGG